MANVPITAGSGTVIATDVVTADGSNVQIIELGTVAAGVLTRTPIPAPSVFYPLAAVAVTAGTPVAAWTPTNKFRFMGGAVSLTVAGSVIFKNGTTEIWRTPLLAANTPYNIPENFGNGIKGTVTAQALNIDVTATGSVSGGVFGTDEA